jgi:LysR family transcriptional regulator, transcription activator of glutamate synthase operon
MDLRQLQFVEAVARLRNFTRAAEELHVAQPALSKAVSNLEMELGVRLFDRTSRRVSLTDAGEMFTARARRILADLDLLRSEMDELHGGVRGSVRVSTWYHLEPDLPAIIRDFTTALPGVDVSILELPAAETLDALRHDQICLGIVLLYPGLDLSEIGYEGIRTESLILVVPAGDPLAALSEVGLDRVAQRPFIAALPGTALRHWLDRALARAGVDARVVIETNEVAAGVAYVAAGLGVAVVPRSVVTRPTGTVATVPLAGEPPITMALAWHDGGLRTPIGERVLAHARADFAHRRAAADQAPA